MEKRITMDDIAKKVGVSKYAVSRALSGKSGVSELTRERVIDAAKLLGYEMPIRKPNASLDQKSEVVLAIPRPDLGDSEYWMHVVAGAETAARKMAINLVVRSISRSTRPEDIISPNTQGLLVAGSTARVILGLHTSRIPVVLMTYTNPLEKVDAVKIADFEGGTAVGAHLIELGHRRFLFIGNINRPSYHQRYLGFKEAVVRTNDYSFELLSKPNLRESAVLEKAFLDLLHADKLPTAIFCATDSLALLTLWTLSRLGVSVPESTSVVGYNDIPDASRCNPTLTTLSVDKETIGQLAIEKLVRRQISPSAPYIRTSVTPQLIVRESISTPPGRMNDLT